MKASVTHTITELLRHSMQDTSLFSIISVWLGLIKSFAYNVSYKLTNDAVDRHTSLINPRESDVCCVGLTGRKTLHVKSNNGSDIKMASKKKDATFLIRRLNCSGYKVLWYLLCYCCSMCCMSFQQLDVFLKSNGIEKSKWPDRQIIWMSGKLLPYQKTKAKKVNNAFQDAGVHVLCHQSRKKFHDYNLRGFISR